MSKWTIYDNGDLIMCNRYEAVRKHDSLHDFWQVRRLPDEPSEKAKVLFQTDDSAQVIKFFLDEYERNTSMSNYTSENTHILATHVQKDGNKRMLLFHICESGRHEYVVGSYFQEHRYDGALGYERVDYEWDWGHYFSDLLDAVDYWKREVLGEEQPYRCGKCGETVYATDRYCPVCGECLS